MNTEDNRIPNLKVLSRIEVVKPKGAGSLWKGIKHSLLAQEVLAQLFAAGVTVPMGSEMYWVSKDKQEFLGLWPLKLKDARPSHDKGHPFIAVQTSNNRRKSMTAYVGFITHPGDQIMVLEYIPIGRKREKKFNLAMRISTMVQHALKSIQEHSTEKTLSQLDDATPSTDVDGLLCKLARSEVLPWSRIGELNTMVKEGMSKLKWFLSVYEVAARGPIFTLMDRLLIAKHILW